MISTEYDFYAPASVGEALTLLDRFGGSAKLIAGGMSFVPMMTLGLAHPEVVISMNKLPDLAGVREDGGSLRIGAMTPHRVIKSDPLIAKHAPLLAEAAGFIGDTQVRNRGTIGGALVHADPAADYLPVALALGAKIKLKKTSGERTVKAIDFFQGIMTTSIEDGELLVEIEIPKQPAGCGSSYQRLHRVEGNYAIVAAAAVIEAGFKNARIGLGGVGPVPVLVDVGAHVAGGVNDAALERVGAAAVAAASDAFGDLNGDAAYKQAMASVYAKRVVREAAARLR